MHTPIFKYLSCLASAALLLSGSYVAEGESDASVSPPVHVARIPGAGGANKQRVGAATDPGKYIKYTPGGRLLTGTTPVHLYYYGNWTSTQKGLLEEFTSNIGSSTWYSIMSTYYFQASPSAPKQFVKTGPGSVVLGKTFSDETYYKGKNLEGGDTNQILGNAITRGDLPDDPDALYVLFTSPDVMESYGPGGKFCDNYCGYHTYSYEGGNKHLFIFVGHPDICSHRCSTINRYASPNGDIGVDSMFSTLAHEIAEAVSDPEPFSGWVDADNEENADKCAWDYGVLLGTLNDGASYNLVIGDRKYLIQQNWNAENQQCENYRKPTDTPTTTPGIPQGPSACSTPLAGIDFRGADVTAVAKGSIAECCNACTGSCNVYTYANGVCYLKDSSKSDLQVVGNQNGLSSGLRSDVSLYNIDLFGHDIGNRPAQSSSECFSQCKATQSCKAATFSSQQRVCYLKDGYDASNVRKTVGVESIIVSGSSTGPKITAIVDGVDIAGGDVGTTQRLSASDCEGDCTAGTCDSFTWFQGTCYLKRTDASQVTIGQKPGCRSAFRLNAVLKNIDFPGNDANNFFAGSPAACFDNAKSQIGNNVKAATWSPYNGGTCYLKSRSDVATAKVVPGLSTMLLAA